MSSARRGAAALSRPDLLRLQRLAKEAGRVMSTAEVLALIERQRASRGRRSAAA